MVYAENNETEQGGIEEGIVIYHIKYDYDVISNFLGMSGEEYENYCKVISPTRLSFSSPTQQLYSSK